MRYLTPRYKVRQQVVDLFCTAVYVEQGNYWPWRGKRGIGLETIDDDHPVISVVEDYMRHITEEEGGIE